MCQRAEADEPSLNLASFLSASPFAVTSDCHSQVGVRGMLERAELVQKSLLAMPVTGDPVPDGGQLQREA